MVTEVEEATDGSELPLDTLAHTFAYNTSTQLSTDTVSYAGNTYVQTYTYTSGLLTGISKWVKQ